jgi:hypothetical protein
MKKSRTVTRRSSTQGIVRDERGQDQPADRARAQHVTTTRAPSSAAKRKAKRRAQ